MDRNDKVALLEESVFENDIKCLWVFAYGSLCWRPGFEFHKAVPGSVTGFQRRFWQGNTVHRGTTEKPGRVATLVEDLSEGEVHGVAFALTGSEALSYLSNRECAQGGYMSKFIDFQPIEGERFKVLVYVATPLNPHWLGDADLDEIADQIVTSEGQNGHNVEYLLRLANFMRAHFPDKKDEHLFSLEEKVLWKINVNQMCLKTMMGSGEGCISFMQKPSSRESSPSQERRNREGGRVETFEHTARVPNTKLRCLNI
ncbi:glutathione-specific gamma-glutamylcyclotransferase 1 [Anthonomus grandis grandis]|uniref:glutathione-specific gamma-glutamylcyclotransferase 1 n=1 Tax=Anthonomus grandis grandis TaxID=2921223 RepID=UPI0021653F3D|nr:glutathione-specific gamma-glutamylcyclotransferase 1 [Anthonomus grandis grandis]